MCNPFLDDESPDDGLSRTDIVLLSAVIIIMVIIVTMKDAYDLAVKYLKGEMK